MTHTNARHEWIGGLIFIFVLNLSIVFTVIVLFFWVHRAAGAHESADWIQQQSLKNRVGELCCGTYDCGPIDKADFITSPDGYVITHKARGPQEERIPYSEAMPFSIDGRLWVCRKPDGTRRCVFDQPPGM